MPDEIDQDSQPSLSARERPGVPSWVKIFALIALVVAAALAVVALFGGGHGPGMHSSALDVFGEASFVSIGSVLS